MAADHGWFRGEGGGVWRFDFPLSDVFADQVAKGHLVEVDGPDGLVGSAGASDAPAAPARRRRPKAEADASEHDEEG